MFEGSDCFGQEQLFFFISCYSTYPKTFFLHQMVDQIKWKKKNFSNPWVESTHFPAAVGKKKCILNLEDEIKNAPDHMYITLGFASGKIHDM